MAVSGVEERRNHHIRPQASNVPVNVIKSRSFFFIFISSKIDRLEAMSKDPFFMSVPSFIS